MSVTRSAEAMTCPICKNAEPNGIKISNEAKAAKVKSAINAIRYSSSPNSACELNHNIAAIIKPFKKSESAVENPLKLASFCWSACQLASVLAMLSFNLSSALKSNNSA